MVFNTLGATIQEFRFIPECWMYCQRNAQINLNTIEKRGYTAGGAHVTQRVKYIDVCDEFVMSAAAK